MSPAIQDKDDDSAAGTALAFIVGIGALGGAVYFISRFFGISADRATEAGWGIALLTLAVLCLVALLHSDGSKGKPVRPSADNPTKENQD
jgi:nitrate/nitrite transporter NarK